MTSNMYYSFVLHERDDKESLVINGGRLLQQFMVDAYVCIEQERLNYIRENQNKFRTDYVSGIRDAISRGDSEGRSIGKRLYLPASFVGGPRYMYQHYQDALAVCRTYGNPQYFITFTCNVNWPEIQRHVSRSGIQRAQNRLDIIALLYTIEFQKRGLPHCHTLLWVTAPSQISSGSDVDKYISAELPDPVVNPALHAIVTNCMFHGPCGLLNPAERCMQNGNTVMVVTSYILSFLLFIVGKVVQGNGYDVVVILVRLFEDVRTVRGRLLPSFRSACYVLGFLGEDKEWLLAFDEAAVWASASQLCSLFGHLLLFCDVTDPLFFWSHAWKHMGDDILHSYNSSRISSSIIGDDLLKDHILVEIEKILISSTPSKTLSDFNLPTPSRINASTFQNRLLLEERSYDTLELHQQYIFMSTQLNAEQKKVFDQIHLSATSASGIASLLLPAGRTAHSRLKIPLDLSDASTCHIKKKTHLGQLLQETFAIVWDEATMNE
ncbi:hypothetical protein LXL04_019943 [Taraxacum kok-saghyz]